MFVRCVLITCSPFLFRICFFPYQVLPYSSCIDQIWLQGWKALQLQQSDLVTRLVDIAVGSARFGYKVERVSPVIFGHKVEKTLQFGICSCEYTTSPSVKSIFKEKVFTAVFVASENCGEQQNCQSGWIRLCKDVNIPVLCLLAFFYIVCFSAICLRSRCGFCPLLLPVLRGNIFVTERCSPSHNPRLKVQNYLLLSNAYIRFSSKLHSGRTNLDCLKEELKIGVL